MAEVVIRCGRRRYRSGSANKFLHHEAASDRVERVSGTPLRLENLLALAAYSDGRTRVQLVNLTNIITYVVARIVPVALSGQASGEFRLTRWATVPAEPKG
jgi:hypothetical protein